MHHLFRRALAAFRSPACPSTRSRKAPRTHIDVEPLEERLVLTAFTSTRISGDLVALYNQQQALGSGGTPSTGPTDGGGSGTTGSLTYPKNLLHDTAGNVIVDITTSDIAAITPGLQQLGFVTTAAEPQYNFVEGRLPVAAIGSVESLVPLGLMGVLASYATPRVGTVTSQATFIQQADRVQAGNTGTGYTGTGVTVGVLSDSYDAGIGLPTDATTDILNGDLPPVNRINVLKEGPFDSTDEGRAMMQVIHDVAPGASLAFSSADYGQADFAQQIKNLADPTKGNAQIVVDDIGYFSEPVFQDGIIAQAINSVVTGPQHVAYFSAAGNDEGSVYESTTVTLTTDSLVSGSRFYNFGTPAAPDSRQEVQIPDGSRVQIDLQWDDPFYTTNGVKSHLNFYLVDHGTNIIEKAGVVDNIKTGQPDQVINYLNRTGADQNLDLLIEVASNSTRVPQRVRWENFTGATNLTVLTHAAPSSPDVSGHPSTTYSESVGAVPYYNRDIQESFSATGPSVYLFSPTGTRLATPEVRPTPKVSSVDGAATSFFGQQFDDARAADYNFYGTSEAAPHAAAVAALVLQSHPGFTPSQIYSDLETTADPVGTQTGYNTTSGNGLVDAWNAVYGSQPQPVATNFSDDFEDGRLPGMWSEHSTVAGRIEVTNKYNPDGTRQLVLTSDNVVDQRTTPSLNELTLHLTVAPNDPVRFAFKSKSLGAASAVPMPASFTGSVNSDGVSFSVDGGTTWYRIVDLAAEGASFTQYSFDLASLARAAGVTIGTDLQIMFQQYGAYAPEGTLGYGFPDTTVGEGLTFDDLTVTQPNALVGVAFNDINGDGKRQSGEPGLPGTIVKLSDANNNFIGSTATDVNGVYSFGNLAPGTYILQEVPQQGFSLTTPNPVTVTVGSTTTSPIIPGPTFGNAFGATVSGLVFSDANGDGVRQAGEAGLDGVTVNLINSAGAVVQSVTTSGGGLFSFGRVGTGTYTVSEVLQPGSVQTTPTSPSSFTVNVGSNATPTSGLVFGVFQPLTVSGRVFNDLNGNGAFDQGEPGVSGWTVTLTNTTTNVSVSTVTSATGSYSFNNVGPGSYTLTDVLQSGYLSSLPPVLPFTFTASSGGSVTQNFGVFKTVSVSGLLYNDLNGDGVNQPGEPALPNFTVQLVNPTSGATTATATTDATGHFTFTGVGPGPLVVNVIAPPGWTNSGSPFFPASGVNTTNLLIGAFKTVTVSGLVFNDANGNGVQDPTGTENGLNGFTVQLVNTATGAEVDTQTTNGGQFSFTGVGPGTYKVVQVPRGAFSVTTPAGDVFQITTRSGADVTGLAFGDHRSAAPALIAVGSDAGKPSEVKVYNASGALVYDFSPFGAFAGGVHVAVGDVNGDGVNDIVVAAGPGGGPHVEVYDGSTGQRISSFYAYAPTFTGGVNVGCGDVNGDGYADIITGTGFGGGPHVKVFDGITGAVFASFYAYDANFSGGVNVACGDITGDGYADIVTGAGPGGGPHVKVFDGVSLAMINNFMAFAPSFSGGVTVACGRFFGGQVDIIAGEGPGGGAEARIFNGRSGVMELAAPVLTSVTSAPAIHLVGDAGYSGGTRVAAADFGGSGQDKIVVGVGPNQRAEVQVLDPVTLRQLDDFFAFDQTFSGGVWLGGA